MNKEERYILGQKIKIRTEEEKKQYNIIKETAQQKNKRLGYGEGKTQKELSRRKQREEQSSRGKE